MAVEAGTGVAAAEATTGICPSLDNRVGDVMGEMGQEAAQLWQTEAISGFARSELFDRTFQEGMDLVEETAGYLDGAGRQDSKLLSRSAALSYAAESMRLTTRLMQVASWLLVQRAVREGDMAPEAALDASYRLGAEPDPDRGDAEPLPGPLAALLARSERLFDRVRHLDARMYAEACGEVQPPHPVLSQMERLKDAFGL
jgi:regulator of CtrA degradation